MALIHWWPLNGDTKDYGLNPISDLFSSTSYDTNGKIGKCVTVSKSVSSQVNLSDLNGKHDNFSVSMWIKLNSGAAFTIYNDIFTLWLNDNSQLRLEISSSTAADATSTTICLFGNDHYTDGSGARSFSVNMNTWVHVTFVVDGDYIDSYLNGVRKQHYGYTAAGYTNYTLNGKFRLGDTGGMYCSYNDVRIYDHALTIKEIKELSKALVLHYDFEDEEIEGTTNLSGIVGYEMKCGNNDYGTRFTPPKWGEANGYVINKASGGYNNMPMSEWHKTAGRDGAGFYTWLNRGFTLTEGHTYTASVYVYSNKAASTNGYICSVNSSALSNYYIVGSGFNLQKGWQRLSYTFTVASGKTATDYCYSPLIYSNPDDNEWVIKLSGFQIEEKDHATVFTKGNRPFSLNDCSGFNNDGTFSNSSAQIIEDEESPMGMHYLYTPAATEIRHPRCLLSGTDQVWTVNAWIYPMSNARQSKINNFNVGNYAYLDANARPILYLNSGTNDYYRYGNTVLTPNTWIMMTFVFDNTNDIRDVYYNGVKNNASGGPNKTSTPSGIPDTVTLLQNFEGYIADYKEYATALSATDVLKEYQSMANVDKQYNLTTRYIVEDDSREDYALLEKNGVFNCKEISEIEYPFFRTYDNGRLCAGSFSEGGFTCSGGDKGSVFRNFIPEISIANNTITITNFDELDDSFKNNNLTFGFRVEKTVPHTPDVSAIKKDTISLEYHDRGWSGLDYKYFNENYFNPKTGVIAAGFLDEWDDSTISRHEEGKAKNTARYRNISFYLVYAPFASQYADKFVQYIYHYDNNGKLDSREQNIRDYY